MLKKQQNPQNYIKLFTSIHEHSVVMKRIQNIEIQKKKYLPAFYTLKESHIASTHFQGILLCTQKQKEATKSKELIAKKDI